MGKSARNPVSSVERTFEVIDALRELEGAGVTELADRLDIPKSTAHTYLSTLEQEEYVVREGDEYHVGVRFLEVGGFARRRTGLYSVAKPEVDRLAEETENFANLMVEEHGWGIYIHRSEKGGLTTGVDSYVGTRVHLHSTGLGKAILAHLPEQRLDEIVDRHGLRRETPNTITSRDALDRELETIRERGYAFDREEYLAGLRCVAAPILDENEEVLGAISVSGPTNRFKGEYLERTLPDEVLEVANLIELNVTYS